MEKDSNQWVQYEQQGQNIGAQIMLNPHIFSEMVREVEGVRPKKTKVSVVDIGAGTGSLSREFLLENIKNDSALSHCADGIKKARKRIARVINLDNQNHYLEEGRKITSDERISFDIANAHDLPLEDASADLIVSRQMLMHLSPDDLQQHFKEVSRVLRHSRAYIFTVTNPGVDHLKSVLSKGAIWDSILQPGQRYQYPLGPVGIPDHIQASARKIITNMIGALPEGKGTEHFLDQYLHMPDCYIDAARSAHLLLEKINYLHAVIPGFEKSHARYYPPALPNSILFKVRRPIWDVKK